MWRLFNTMRDMYSNVTLILTAVIVIVLTQVNPKAKPTEENAKPPGAIAVSIAWPAASTDVDLWTTGPGQDKATGYTNRDGMLFSLSRDDLGTANDPSPYNMEEANARETPAGDYVINIHGFSLKEPLVVHIEVALRSPGQHMQKLVTTDMELRPHQERTVIRFTLDDQGKVVPGSVNQVFKPLRSAP